MDNQSGRRLVPAEINSATLFVGSMFLLFTRKVFLFEFRCNTQLRRVFFEMDCNKSKGKIKGTRWVIKVLIIYKTPKNSVPSSCLHQLTPPSPERSGAGQPGWQREATGPSVGQDRRWHSGTVAHPPATGHGNQKSPGSHGLQREGDTPYVPPSRTFLFLIGRLVPS